MVLPLSVRRKTELTGINFSNRVAIVTGAGGGLGREHALELARRGAKVVVNDLGGSVDGTGHSKSTAENVVEEIRTFGGEAIGNETSVCDSIGVQEMIDLAVKEYGRIDIIVANAGILRDKSFAKMTDQDIDTVFDVHLRGTFLPVRAAWPIMKEQCYGRIVVTTSSTGLYGNFGQANYAAAKLGLVGLMNTLKIEGAKSNIHVNAICPVASTRMTASLMSDQMNQVFKPEYVTPAVINLVKEDAPNGVIISAGAGAFSMTQILETRGAYVGVGDDLSAEAFASMWSEITDTNGARPLKHGSEHGAHILECVSKGKPRKSL